MTANTMIWISNVNHIYCWGANHLKKYKRSNNARFNLSLNLKWLVSFFPFLPCFFISSPLPNMKLFTYSTRSEMIRSNKSSEMWSLELWLWLCILVWLRAQIVFNFFLFRVWYGVTEKKEKKMTELFFCVEIFTQNLSKNKTER